MKNDYTEQGRELLREIAVSYVDAYLRYSSALQNDGISIEMQMDDINEYCAKNNLVVRKWYIDTATSASKKEAETRDAFFELVQDIKAGVSAKSLLVYSTSRAFRNSYESHKYRKFLREHGIRLMSVTQHIDEDTSTGRLTTSILADIDQYKAEELSDYVKSALRALAKRGFYVGASVPFGYITVPAIDEKGIPRKKYALDEKAAPVVREMFNRYLQGSIPRQIADWLNAQGFVTQRGNLFSPDAVLKILKNDFYIGTRRLQLKGQDELVIEDAVDPIIDKHTFALVQQAIADRRNDRAPKARWRKTSYLLTGKIICMECARRGDERFLTGRTSHVTTRGEKYIYNNYVCQGKTKYKVCSCKSISKSLLENYVLEQIKEKILNESVIDRIADEVLATMSTFEQPITDEKTLHKRKSEILAELVTLAKMKARREIDDEVYALTKQEYDAEKAQIDLDLNAIEQSKRNTITRESIADTIHGMIADIETGNDEVLKTVFDRTVERVEVDNDEVIVCLVVTFSPFALKDDLCSGKYAVSAKILRSEL